MCQFENGSLEKGTFGRVGGTQLDFLFDVSQIEQ